MENQTPKGAAADIATIAKAERILNRTLAYQAAIAAHELKEALNLDVEELRLAVSASADTPGAYRVICTIATLAAPAPVTVEVVVAPDNAVVRKRGAD